MGRINQPPDGGGGEASPVAWHGWRIRVFSGTFKLNGNDRNGHVDSQLGELIVRDPGTPEGLALNAMRVWEAAKASGLRPKSIPPTGHNGREVT